MSSTPHRPIDGTAIVYCEGAYLTTNGKTAHGLVRRTERYRVLSVVDSTAAGQDAGEALDRRHRAIPIVASLEAAWADATARDLRPSHFVIGLAPDGGRLEPVARQAVREALRAGLSVDSGLHDWLTEDDELVALAAERGVVLRDVRKPPPRDELHFWSGKIAEVSSFLVAILGTDSAVGKRTTAWLLRDALEQAGVRTELCGTGQTAWLQGARYGIIMDALPNDFVSGELEHAVWSAWSAVRPEVIVIEGQGSLLNPAYPGGFEILASTRPDAIVLQHAPARRDYDGFPGYRIHSLGRQLEVIELVADRPVVALTINHQGVHQDQVARVARDLRDRVGLPTFDVVLEGAAGLAELIRSYRGRTHRGAPSPPPRLAPPPAGP